MSFNYGRWEVGGMPELKKVAGKNRIYPRESVADGMVS